MALEIFFLFLLCTQPQPRTTYLNGMLLYNLSDCRQDRQKHSHSSAQEILSPTYYRARTQQSIETYPSVRCFVYRLSSLRENCTKELEFYPNSGQKSLAQDCHNLRSWEGHSEKLSSKEEVNTGTQWQKTLQNDSGSTEDRLFFLVTNQIFFN